MNNGIKQILYYSLAAVISFSAIKYIDNNDKKFLRNNFSHKISDVRKNLRIDYDNTIALLIDMEQGFRKYIDSSEYNLEVNNQIDFIKYLTNNNIKIITVKYGHNDKLDKSLEETLKSLDNYSIVIKDYSNGFDVEGHPFKRSRLEKEIRKHKPDNIIFMGAYASACVLQTAMTAAEKGYVVITTGDLIMDQKINSDADQSKSYYKGIGYYFEDYHTLIDLISDKK